MAFTFFFRDSQTLELALDLLAPSLADGESAPIWDAGCAHGPEPYTLAILLSERLTPRRFADVEIWATDLDATFRLQVESGEFREDEIRRVPPHVGPKYFRPAGAGRVQAIEELRQKVTFRQHDLLSLTPPRRGFRMILCKNVLLHLSEPQRIAVLEMFRDSLADRGVLALEHTQKLPEPCQAWFRPAASYAQVFQKIAPAVPRPSAPRASAERSRWGRPFVHPDLCFTSPFRT